MNHTDLWFISRASGVVSMVAMTVVFVLGMATASRKAWRTVHLLTYALWPMAIAHGIGMSSADQPLLLWTTVACAAVGLGAIAMRMLHTSPDTQRRVLVNAHEWS